MLFRRANCCFLNGKTLELTTRMDNNPKMFQFSNFSHSFRQIFEGLRGLRSIASKGHQGKDCLSISFFDFFNGKCLNLTPKLTKIPKFSNFQSFYAIVSQFSIDFVDWNVERGHQGKNVLSSRLFPRVNCSFLSENVSNWHQK